jgi:hypothetical protein
MNFGGLIAQRGVALHNANPTKDEQEDCFCNFHFGLQHELVLARFLIEWH